MDIKNFIPRLANLSNADDGDIDDEVMVTFDRAVIETALYSVLTEHGEEILYEIAEILGMGEPEFDGIEYPESTHVQKKLVNYLSEKIARWGLGTAPITNMEHKNGKFILHGGEED